MSELRLAPGSGRFAWINAAAWADPHIDLLIAHPDDRDGVAALPDHRNLRINTYCPYRNRTSVGPLD